MPIKTYCGYIAIIGRPNVGKSTLLNRILGHKVSITSHKPQTTRHQIFGIKTKDNVQAIYVDTPGIHAKSKHAMGRFMNKAAITMIQEVNVIVFMIDACVWTSGDELVLRKLQQTECPVILVLNKIDLLRDKQELLPKIKQITAKMNFVATVPISVKKNINLDRLENLIHTYLPENIHFFPPDQLTNKDDNFMIAEIVREKIMRVTSQEVPYGTAVVVESCKMQAKVLHIDVVIWVERKGQKIIIIGKGGEKLKEIGRCARIDLEKKFAGKVFLSLWVKVKTGWVDDKQQLNRLGF
jgi:GTP-binding protein Era